MAIYFATHSLIIFAIAIYKDAYPSDLLKSWGMISQLGNLLIVSTLKQYIMEYIGVRKILDWIKSKFLGKKKGDGKGI